MNVHIYPSPLTHESRILRITDALVEAGVFQTIEVIGVAHSGLAQRESVDAHRTLVRLPRRLFAKGESFIAKLCRTLEWSARVLIYLRRQKISCINAHSLAVLPLCALGCALTGALLVYDTHELETETTGYKGLRQKLGRLIEKLLIHRSAMVCVVSDSIADWYAHTYDIQRPTVVRNIPQYQAPVGYDRSAMRASLGLHSERVVFIYQGGFIRGRGVERLLRVFARLPGVDLVCMGSGPLQSSVQQAADDYPNIHLVPPVAPHEVLAYSQAADIGICLTENSCLSHYYSLPNKIFEYLHAGLPIIVNSLFEQERLINEFDCGWVAAEDDAAFARLLSGIDHTAIMALRPGVQAALQGLQWSEEKACLIEAYKEHGFV
ncbi:glycosyltransferase [Stutzerimonas nitrititolerans]|uniref:glycosyltransferase n=1 Tax=Stutzerimonas nitrititolerans TaxID=2482751 RepID=UPI00289B5AAB|nr:glycosyltransferase [Stutzerimonas nitrititolerans]